VGEKKILKEKRREGRGQTRAFITYPWGFLRGLNFSRSLLEAAPLAALGTWTVRSRCFGRFHRALLVEGRRLDCQSGYCCVLFIETVWRGSFLFQGCAILLLIFVLSSDLEVWGFDSGLSLGARCELLSWSMMVS
jgi:hypothetical protein